MSDPVAQRAEPIISHMNSDHKEALADIVAHRLPNLSRPPNRARMTAIDANGFTIEYRIVQSLLWNPSGEVRKVRVTFSPAINEASEVRQRIIDIANEAGQKRSKTYKVAYSVPRDLPVWVVLNLAMLFIARPDVFASVAARSPIALESLNVLFDAIRVRLPNGAASMLWFYKWLLTAHAGEATLMAVYSWRRGARGTVWLRWVATQFLVGFTTFANFSKLNPTVSGAKKA